jgi:protein GP30.3
MTNSTPLIVGFFDGDEEVRILSNFAQTPFSLDDLTYQSVEGFWQGLKTEMPMFRRNIAELHGLAAKSAGRVVATGNSRLFTYMTRLYIVGSEAHHVLLERAIRAKTAQNPAVQYVFAASQNRPLRHMIRSRYGTWRVGDSPALPAIVFEQILTRIRSELQSNTFVETLSLPAGIHDELLDFTTN